MCCFGFGVVIQGVGIGRKLGFATDIPMCEPVVPEGTSGT